MFFIIVYLTVIFVYHLPQPYEVQYDNEDKKRSFVTKDGKATAIFPNQDTYSGQYKGHKRNGKGSYKWERKNASYVGDYVDGFREGNGIMTFPDGSVYHGQWKKNARHGHGVYTYPNGDKVRICSPRSLQRSCLLQF
jgi:hypothetical protein